jgi:putative transposase
LHEEKHFNRRSIRLKDYDYSGNGKYFITICTQYHLSMFGDINDGRMILNNAGIMVQKWWRALGERYKLGIEPYVIMPNHIHGIITVSHEYEGTNECEECEDTHESGERGENVVSPLQRPVLGEYVSWFKRMSTNEYIRNVKNNNWPPFHKRLWQRNYWEHIIRNQTELDNTNDYIYNNPKNRSIH